jgi:hypothetical protein
VKWLGADFEDRLFFASDYFDKYEAPASETGSGEDNMLKTRPKWRVFCCA